MLGMSHHVLRVWLINGLLQISGVEQSLFHDPSPKSECNQLVAAAVSSPNSHAGFYCCVRHSAIMCFISGPISSIVKIPRQHPHQHHHKYQS